MEKEELGRCAVDEALTETVLCVILIEASIYTVPRLQLQSKNSVSS